jgi:hypothetical protein
VQLIKGRPRLFFFFFFFAGITMLGSVFKREFARVFGAIKAEILA